MPYKIVGVDKNTSRLKIFSRKKATEYTEARGKGKVIKLKKKRLPWNSWEIR